MSDSLKRGSEVTIYYHFLSSRDAMTDLERKMIKVSRIVNLNDLFELRPYLLINRDKRSRLEKLRSQIAKTHGMVCFSRDWQEPLLWGHYADRNRGIALGFEVSKRYAASPVKYPLERERDPFGDRRLIGEDEYISVLGYTKYANWAYEKEYRFFIKLDDCITIEGDYFLQFSRDLSLRSVVLGPEHPYKNKNTYRRSAAYLARLVKSFGADILVTRAERKGYRIVRCGRWTPLFEELMKKL